MGGELIDCLVLFIPLTIDMGLLILEAFLKRVQFWKYRPSFLDFSSLIGGWRGILLIGACATYEEKCNSMQLFMLVAPKLEVWICVFAIPSGFAKIRLFS